MVSSGGNNFGVSGYASSRYSKIGRLCRSMTEFVWLLIRNTGTCCSLFLLEVYSSDRCSSFGKSADRNV
jgi:hypothetical protein